MGTAKSTNHDKFIDAKRLAKVLSDIEPNAPDFSDKLHAVGARCGWCQDNLNTWLLLRLNKQLGAILRKLDGLSQNESVEAAASVNK